MRQDYLLGVHDSFRIRERCAFVHLKWSGIGVLTMEACSTHNNQFTRALQHAIMEIEETRI